MARIEAITLATKAGKNATAIFNDDSNDIRGLIAKTTDRLNRLLKKTEPMTVGAIREIIEVFEKAKCFHELQLDAFDFWKLEHQDTIALLEDTQKFDSSRIGEYMDWACALEMQERAVVSLRRVKEYISLLNDIKII